MKKQFTGEQIISFLREAEPGVSVMDLCRRYGFTEASYYLWIDCSLVSGPMDTSITSYSGLAK